jgi:hypothetical protein
MVAPAVIHKGTYLAFILYMYSKYVYAQNSQS